MSEIGRVAAGALIVAIVLVAVVVIADVDVSAWRDFERDAIMMRAPLQNASLDRYYDPSPYDLWLPSDLFVWDSVRHAHLPLWDRLQGGGYSAINAVHEGVLHPLRWMTAFVPRRNAPSVLIILTLCIAFAGMYLLARIDLRYSIAASVFAALMFTFSAVMVSNVHFSGALLPLAHIPWLVLFSRARRSGFTVTALVLTMASLLACGHPLLEAAALGTAGLVVIADAVRLRSAQSLVVYVATAAGGALVAAPQLLPPLLAQPEMWTYKTQTSFGVSYVPFPFRSWLEALRAMAVDTYDKSVCCIDLPVFYLYVGIAAVVLVVIAAVHRKVPALLVLLVITFAVGVPGPWMTMIAFRPVSFFKPWYFMGAFSFFLACVATAGFDVLWRSTMPRKAIGAALAAIVAVTYLYRAGEVLEPRIGSAAAPGEAVNFLHRDRDLYRVMSLWGQTHMPNASRLTGIEDIRLSGPLITNRYDLWWRLVDPGVLSRAYPTTRVTDRLDSPLAGDFNVKYVIQSRLPPRGTFHLDYDERDRDRALSPLLMNMPVVFRTPWVEIRRNTANVRPRAHFADAVVPAPSLQDAMEMLAADRSLAARASVVETERPLQATKASGTVALSYPSERAVQMDVRSATGGVVVLHDSFAEGWSASVDGRPAEVLPVNVLSRGVEVPPGAHRIEMRYVPPGFPAGIAISVATLLSLFLIIPRLTKS